MADAGVLRGTWRGVFTRSRARVSQYHGPQSPDCGQADRQGVVFWRRAHIDKRLTLFSAVMGLALIPRGGSDSPLITPLSRGRVGSVLCHPLR